MEANENEVRTLLREMIRDLGHLAQGECNTVTAQSVRSLAKTINNHAARMVEWADYLDKLKAEEGFERA